MDREKQIERMEGAEHRATAFFDRCLSTPLARAILKRGNPDRPKARKMEDAVEDQPRRVACG